MMLKKLPYTITSHQLAEAQKSANDFNGKTTLNYPTGRFFYDSWKIKKELEGTIWDAILKTLPVDMGEARLIKLDEHTCYTSHGDIDDRWHLNITGDKSYIIDLTTQAMYAQTQDLTWWDMNAGPIHSAANFGNCPRYQLVIRKLLNKNVLKDPVRVSIYADEFRYEFDESFSPWLNKASKEGIISDFDYKDFTAYFSVEKSHLEKVTSMATDKLVVVLLDGE